MNPPAPEPAASPEPTQPQDQAEPPAQPSSADPGVNNPESSNSGASNPAAGTDADIVTAQPAGQPAGPALSQPPSAAADPDGDIVHPGALEPGELGEGTSIRVRLLDRLSTVDSEKGEPFRSQVATDILQGGQVLIPAGTEIDGNVAEVSTGHPGGTGTIRLHPDTVILADGTRYHLRAEISGTPGSKTRVGDEGTIRPDSRWKRDTFEYGGVVGAGVVTGAIVAGPIGALTGGLVGTGIVTTHLLINHPQATLEAGTTLIFTLTAPLRMAPAGASGN
jgi:hypothetical protein